MVQELILFFMTFLFVFVIYELFIVKKYAVKENKKTSKKKKNNSKSKKKTEPIEVTYLVKKYKLDLDKLNFNKLLHVVALVSSFDISLIVSLVLLLNNFILEVVVGFILIIIVIVVSYHFVYLFYKKKGMIKDEL